MAINKIAIIGNFGDGNVVADGQVIKTKEIKNSIEKYTDKEVTSTNTFNWKKHPLKLIFKIFSSFKKNDALIMMVAHNGVIVFSFLLTILNKFYKKDLYYSVIGGWLPSLVQSKKRLSKRLKRFKCIFVETNTMKRKMEDQGFNNIQVIPNFKDISPLLKKEYTNEEGILNFCIFSRISKLKGVEDAINVFSKLYKKYNYIKLNIYGSVVEEFKEEFNLLLKSNSKFVEYFGCAPSDKSIEILEKQYMLIFPTKSFTEGIPGTIIDAYSSSLPVICSKWESYSDIVNERVGIFYDFNDLDDMERKVEFCILNKSLINNKRVDCFEEAFKYSSEKCIKRIICLMENRI